MSEPEIVCGPVLRRVTPSAVSVFLALRTPRKVTLRVYSAETAEGVGATLVQEGTAETVRLGERLHVVTVTSAGVVAAGADLRYQVFFGNADGTATPVPEGATTLFSPGMLLGGVSSDGRGVVCYELPGRRLPGFQVAPDDPAELRVLHGGDRSPDGEGRDALVTADRLVRDALTEPSTGPRPHLLVLTGDQVRTDDASAFLLALCRATAAKWGLAHDPLPGLVDAEQPAVLGTHRRAELAGRIGLRATANHLLSFAEHVALHLLTLSDAAWPDLPAIEHVHPDLDWSRLPQDLRTKISTGSPYRTPAVLEGEVALYSAYVRARERATAFQASLAAARRAMANVPVLSTMGEHDAAPGWNASRATATRLLGVAAGKRVLANALSANAVFHAWGNTPEQFEAGLPGALLLERLRTWLTPPGPAVAGAQVDDLVGVPSAALARPAAALSYTWALTRDRWQLLVLDTQTDRGYPAAAADAPAPLRDQSVVAAVRLLPAPAVTTMTVVASAVPLLLTQPKEWADPTVRPYSWSSNSASLHFTMTKLTTEKVAGVAGKRTRRVVVLSSGAEHASAVRLRFSATAPAYDSGADAVEAVVGQLTAAPLRHTTPLGRRLHLRGHDSATVLAPWRDFVGWDQVHTPGGGAQRPLPVGVHYTGADRTPSVWTIAAKPQLAEVTPDNFLQLSPQWAWRAEYLRSALVTQPAPGELVEVEPAWEGPATEDDPDGETATSPAEAPPAWNLARFRQAAHNHGRHRTWWAAGTELVGENALGDLTFATVPADRGEGEVPPPVPGAVATVRAAQWWWADDGKGAARRTRFDVRLDPGWGWYDGDRYGGRALRRGDTDARPGVQASYWGVRQNAGTHVADLQHDLAELGFAIVSRDTAGTFGNHTQWAVREFQIYARFENGVREKVYAGAQPARYVDRLERVTVPTDLRFDRPEDKVTGVVDRNTRRLIGQWVADRRRCPVVIEAMTVAGGNPAPPAAGRGNLWHHTEPGVSAPRAFATDFTGRYPVTAADTVAQPASTDPAGGPDQRPRLVILSGWTDDHRVLVQSAVPPPAPVPKPKIEARMDGGQWSRPDTMWPRLEMKPETMLTDNPTVAVLVSDIANPAGADEAARTAARLTARRRLSTYKVVRAVAEVEAIGYFDGINGYDNAFLSMGPCHWTMGKLIQQKPVPALAMPGPHVIAVDKDWAVEQGEFWGFLALLEHLYPETFRADFGIDGIRPAKTWTTPSLWDAGGRKYATYATLTDDLAPRQLTAKVREYDYFHSWHNFYRMLMAVRTDDNVRRAMYRMAGQRICDILAATWPTAAGEDMPPMTTPADGVPRRPRVGEVVTSEWGVALLYRWHILSPGGLFSNAQAQNQLRPAYAFAVDGACGTCAAATARHPIDPWSPSGGPPVDPGFAGDPLTWGDAHEHALVAGIAHRANHHSSDNMRDTINTVRGWPAWFGGANPAHFTLEVNQLPVPGAGVDPAVFPVSERQLKHGRGSFLLDSAGLPYPEGRANHVPGGGA